MVTRILQTEEETGSCQIPVVEASGQVSFQRSIYERNLAVDRMHNFPRFGHGKDIQLLIEGNNAQQADYLAGLLWGSLTVFLLFALWVTLLISCSCAGPRRVGFFSGKQERLKKPTTPDCLKEKRNSTSMESNGVATGGNDDEHQTGAQIRDVISKANPAKLITAAREKKRKIEARFDKRNQFSMLSSMVDVNEIKEDGDTEQENSVDDGQPISERTLQKKQEDENKRTIEAYNEELKQYRRRCHAREQRLYRIRVGGGFCCLGIVLSSVLFMVMSMEDLTQSTQSFRDGIDQMKIVTQLTINTALNLQDRQLATKSSSLKLIQDMNQICPSLSTDLCNNATGPLDCDFSPLPFGNELCSFFYFLDGIFYWNVEELDHVIDDLYSLMDMFDQALLYYPKHFSWAFWVAAGSSLGLGVLCLAILTAMFLISMERPLGCLRYLRSRLIVPLFILLTVIGFLFSIIFITGSISTADFCYNSPDGPVLSMLEVLRNNFQSFVIFFLEFYVRGCPIGEAPPDNVDTKLSVLTKFLLPAIQSLSTAIRNQPNFDATCGTSSISAIAILTSLENQLCIASQTLRDFRDLLACGNWYPIYQETTHNSICQHATSGLTWAASTQMVIIILSLVILTLRIGYYEVDEIMVEKTSSKGCCSKGNNSRL